MRRSICICEPSHCLAAEVQTFKFIYTPATNLPKGAKIRFDIASRGRPIDWEVPKIQEKSKDNLTSSSDYRVAFNDIHFIQICSFG